MGVGVIVISAFAGIAVLVRLLPRKLPKGRDSRELSESLATVDELERRVGELEAGQRRMGELEERLDFAERLLSKQRDAERIAPPKG